ncbi:MAG TPA: proline dehydrogenase family protein [Chitinophagaceae bacterium]|nr:proline dehydrogenase family protein [Chitinophagaceae bacterium]
MQPYPAISFDNTELAFEYKSDRDLRRAHFLFSLMARPWLVKLGVRLAPLALRWRLPVKGLIRQTIFRQFVGGEALEKTTGVVDLLSRYHVKVILDYGVEGREGEENFEKACDVFIRVLEYSATQPNIPFISFKMTGFARFGLLEKMHAMIQGAPGSLMKRYLNTIQQLDPPEREEWHRVRHRVMRLCDLAARVGRGVLIDAEETWIQAPIDALTLLMMDAYNRRRAVVYNTTQHYATDRQQFLRESHAAARERKFILGAKLVRGAYMEKERKRAQQMGYPSPIHADKESTDRDFDESLKYCIDHLDEIALIVASHNERSNLYATELIREKGLPLDHPHLHFSQLYGMSDNITFNLAHAGCSVSKYLPFGQISDVIPYLMRRAQENTSVEGQTGRELSLIKKELARRKSLR